MSNTRLYPKEQIVDLKERSAVSDRAKIFGTPLFTAVSPTNLIALSFSMPPNVEILQSAFCSVGCNLAARFFRLRA